IYPMNASASHVSDECFQSNETTPCPRQRITIVMACYKTGTHPFNEYSYSRLAATSVAITFRKTEQNLHGLVEEGAVSPLVRGVCFM
ncbi:MAG: hypothetical protein WBC78_14510, partial [Candidatus Sulfotelmatobacter sp.]